MVETTTRNVTKVARKVGNTIGFGTAEQQSLPDFAGRVENIIRPEGVIPVETDGLSSDDDNNDDNDDLTNNVKRLMKKMKELRVDPDEYNVHIKVPKQAIMDELYEQDSKRLQHSAGDYHTQSTHHHRGKNRLYINHRSRSNVTLLESLDVFYPGVRELVNYAELYCPLLLNYIANKAGPHITTSNSEGIIKIISEFNRILMLHTTIKNDGRVYTNARDTAHNESFNEYRYNFNTDVEKKEPTHVLILRGNIKYILISNSLIEDEDSDNTDDDDDDNSSVDTVIRPQL